MLTDQLTLSLGLRWEYVGPLTDNGNRVAYYRPTAAARGISSTLLSQWSACGIANGRTITSRQGSALRLVCFIQVTRIQTLVVLFLRAVSTVT